MKLTMECAIDLDEKRKVWISGTAEIGEDDMEHVSEVVGEITANVTSQAMRAHEIASEQVTFQSDAPSGPKTFDD